VASPENIAMEYLAAASYLAIALLVGIEALVLGAVARELATIMRSDAIARRRQLLEEYLTAGQPPPGTQHLPQVIDHVE